MRFRRVSKSINQSIVYKPDKNIPDSKPASSTLKQKSGADPNARAADAMLAAAAVADHRYYL